MKIDVVIPAHNEEAILVDAIQAVQAELATFPHEGRIIVVNNASSDNTEAIALGAGATVFNEPRKGKGFAMAHGAKHADAPLFVFFDADLSAHPSELHNLHRVFETSGADIVIGSRLLDERTTNRAFWRTFSSKMFNLLRKVLLGVSVKDTQCGAKFMNARGRETLAECEENGWFFDMEFLARAERKGLKIVEVPVAWEEFRYAGRDSKLKLLRDAPKALLAMLRIRARLKGYGKTGV